MINQDAGHAFSLRPDGTATISTDTNVTATINAPFTGSGSLIFGGPGTVVLTGASSLGGDLTVNGGTVKITSGGTVQSAMANIARDAGSQATVTVDGAGSAWTITGFNGFLTGQSGLPSGSAAINVLNGGKLSAPI